MANTVIQLKKSIIPGNVPSSLESGEIAINTADGILFYKDPSNIIRTIRTDTTTNAYSVLNVNSSLIIATSNSDILTIDSSGAITLTPDSVTDKFTIGVKSGTVFEEGVVQLYDGVDSTSTSLVATANAVNAVYNLISSGTISTNLYFEEFVASSGQLTFSVAGGYNIGKIRVYVNGVLLSSSDYSATNGTSITLSSPANLNDNVIIEKWYNEIGSYANTFSLQNGILTSNNFITSTNSANQVLDIFSTDSYRSIKYLIQVTSGTDYQVSEALVIHNGTISYITEYGLITTNGVLMSYDTDINSGSVRLLCTPTNSINTIKIIKTSVMV